MSFVPILSTVFELS